MKNEKSLRILLWLAAIGVFMQTLDSTIVNTALPAMAASLGESPLRMQSVVIAYSLAMATLIPASGWIADRFGTRRAFLTAIIVFSVGSLLCAYSHTLAQLVGARVIQGIGGAMLMPVGRLSVLRAFPRERFLQAMSFVAVPGMIGPLIGPTLGGWLVQIASWHWVFLINIPVGVIGAAVTYFYMIDSRDTAQSPFDLNGYLLLAVSMVAISLSLEGLSELKLGQATVIMLLILGMAALSAYWLRAARRPNPLFSLQLFNINTFSVGLLGNLFARTGSGCMPFLIPLVLQVSLGYSALQAGLMMIPTAVAAILAKRFGTPLIVRYGYRKILLFNTILVGLVMSSFALMSAAEPMWLRIAQLLVFGAVNSLQFTAMNTITLKDLDARLVSSGNSLLSMVMMLSMSLGVAAAGALLITFSDLFSQGSTAEALPAFRATFVCVGLITCVSAWIFAQLEADDGPGSTTAKAEVEKAKSLTES